MIQTAKGLEFNIDFFSNSTESVDLLTIKDDKGYIPSGT
jgi:hypothetical protein